MNKFTSFLAVVFFISAGVNAAEKMESRQLSATAHGMMNNGDAFAHQQMAQTQKTSAPTTVAQRQNAIPFSEMDDHEKAMVIHQSMNNAHSFAHVIQAEEHHKQIKCN
ncbi:copper-binding protein [Salmonella enterica subsp. salamae]|uniref:Copper-binding protein n=1 Tax=Salmonella enterica subsp. salamae TaxID=59202 RepID=A0A5Y2S3Q8_SALER|nr:copper-binding protein [Salmonella enterica subsp. salamae]ECJ2313321.1 copper-binding protein [Salmonella enterica subsp. salamae]